MPIDVVKCLVHLKHVRTLVVWGCLVALLDSGNLNEAIGNRAKRNLARQLFDLQWSAEEVWACEGFSGNGY